MADAKEYGEAARDALKTASALSGLDPMADEEFIALVAKPSIQEHDREACGQCCHLWIMYEVAKKMLDAKDFTNGMRRWAEESERRWQATKFVRVYRDALNAGKDPVKVFEELGWQL